MFRPLTVLAALALTTVALAADVPAEPIYKLREASFSAMGSHMKALSILAKNEGAPIEEGFLHAVALHESSKHITVWFPKGTGPDVVKTTEALPKVWSDPEGFTKAAKSLEEATAGLITALEAKDRAALGAALGATGKACGGCHDTFRKPDEK